MKNATIFSIVLAAIVSIVAIVTAHESDPEKDYYANADKLNFIEILDTDEVTLEVLENRNGTLLIERVVGVVLDEDGNGKAFVDDPYYNYISYEKVAGAYVGDVICTFLVYNPANNYEDDIIERYDFIIEKGGNNNEAHQ